MINDKTSLITTKPIIYLANMTKKDYLRKKNKWLPKIHAWIQEHGGGALIPFSIEFEQELNGLKGNQAALEACIKENDATSALPKMIVTGYCFQY
jgi:obg-like ATPase 1